MHSCFVFFAGFFLFKTSNINWRFGINFSNFGNNTYIHCTKKFSIKDFLSKCDQVHRKLWISSHLLKKSLMENFLYCSVILLIMPCRLWLIQNKMVLFHDFFLRPKIPRHTHNTHGLKIPFSQEKTYFCQIIDEFIKFQILFSTVKLKLGHNVSQFIHRFKPEFQNVGLSLYLVLYCTSNSEFWM